MNLKGGSSLNAIPRFAEAGGLVPAGGIEGLRRKVLEVEAAFKAEFHGLEPALSIGMETGAGIGGQILSRAQQEKVIHLLLALPHGITRMEELSPGLVKTSTNLATIGVEDGRLTIGTKQRSSEDAEMQALSDMVRACGALAGAATEVGGDYPGWKPDRGSALLAQAESTYMRLLEKEPVVASIHAGLECGLLTAKIGGLDAISIGATIRDAHSPRESLQIASVQTLWDLVAALVWYRENDTDSILSVSRCQEGQWRSLLEPSFAMNSGAGSPGCCASCRADDAGQTRRDGGFGGHEHGHAGRSSHRRCGDGCGRSPYPGHPSHPERGLPGASGTGRRRRRPGAGLDRIRGGHDFSIQCVPAGHRKRRALHLPDGDGCHHDGQHHLPRRHPPADRHGQSAPGHGHGGRQGGNLQPSRDRPYGIQSRPQGPQSGG
jgi:hypothetical protein